MTEANKARARKTIAGLKPCGKTNLWQGLLKGIDQFNQFLNPVQPGTVPAMMVLTDGQPNCGFVTPYPFLLWGNILADNHTAHHRTGISPS